MNVTYLTIAAKKLQIPLDELKDAWGHGKEVRIPANTHLGLKYMYSNNAIFIHSGLIREYFIDDHNIEHTLRFVQNPSMIAPPLNNVYSAIETDLLSQTLTVIEGRIWELEYIQNKAFANPILFRSIIAIMCESSYKKQRNDIRLNACTARERYMLFLKDFPGVVNEIPLRHIASYLKMTPETISRIRSELSR